MDVDLDPKACPDARPVRTFVDGAVSRCREHFGITYGSVSKDEAIRDVALLGRRSAATAVIEWRIDPSWPDADAIRQAVLREVRFYLQELGERDPWRYLAYHCSTASNVYSTVHIGWFPRDWRSRPVNPSSWTVEIGSADLPAEPGTGDLLASGDEGRAYRRPELDDLHLLWDRRQQAAAVGEDERLPSLMILKFWDAGERARWLRQHFPDLGAAMDRDAVALSNDAVRDIEARMGKDDLSGAEAAWKRLQGRLWDLGGIGMAQGALANAALLRGDIAFRRGERDAEYFWREALDESLSVHREQGAPSARTQAIAALQRLAMASLDGRNPRRARSFLVQALDHAEVQAALADGAAMGDLAITLVLLGDALMDGDPDAAESLFRRVAGWIEGGVELPEGQDPFHLLAGLFERLGDGRYTRRDYAGALEWYRRYLDHAVGSPLCKDDRDDTIAGACARLADAHLKLGNLAEARRFASMSLDKTARLPDGDLHRARADALGRMARVLVCEGNATEAVELLRQALAIAEHLARAEGTAWARHQLALTRRDLARALADRPDEAIEAWEAAVGEVAALLRPEDDGFAAVVNHLASEAGGYALGQGRADVALACFRQALGALERTGDVRRNKADRRAGRAIPAEHFEAARELAVARARVGDALLHLRRWGEARKIYELAVLDLAGQVDGREDPATARLCREILGNLGWARLGAAGVDPTRAGDGPMVEASLRHWAGALGQVRTVALRPVDGLEAAWEDGVSLRIDLTGSTDSWEISSRVAPGGPDTAVLQENLDRMGLADGHRVAFGAGRPMRDGLDREVQLWLAFFHVVRDRAAAASHLSGSLFEPTTRVATVDDDGTSEVED